MKKFIIPALLLAGALSSCSKDEVTDVVAMSDAQLTNTIGLDISSSVSRAMSTDANAIRSNDLAVYYYTTFNGTDAVTNSAGYITFDYSDGGWSQTGNKDNISPSLNWSNIGLGTDAETDTDVTSVSFYSISTGAAYTSTVHTNATYGTLAATETTADAATFESFTQPTAIGSQYDVVSYGNTIESVPAGGTISATYNHALSQVELYADLSSMYAAYVKSACIVNLNETGVATVTNAGVTSWSSSSPNLYTYFNLVDASSATETTGLFIYSQSKYMLSSSENGIPLAVDMIIIPQDVVDGDKTAATEIAALTSTLSSLEDTIEAIVPADKTNITTTEEGNLYTALKAYDAAIGTGITQPYVATMYRMIDTGADGYFQDSSASITTDDDGSVVGYKSASQSGQYQTMANTAIAGTMTPYAVSGTTVRDLDDDNHLYAMVAFTFASDFVFSPQYTYDIILSYASSGGILISKYFYDSYGNITNIPIEGIEVGESVLPDGDTEIGVKVIQSSWISADSTNL